MGVHNPPPNNRPDYSRTQRRSRFKGVDILELRDRRIRELAYFRAQRRGFAPGRDVEDWLDAEQEVDRAFRSLPRG